MEWKVIFLRCCRLKLQIRAPVAAVWQVLGFALSQLNADDFGLHQHAAVSLSPYGPEHAHKLLSVSD